MNKSQINPLPKFFDRYILKVKEENIIDALEESLRVLENVDLNVYQKIGKKTYAQNKWTLNEIYQHLIDNERIQSYRALRIIRGDKMEMPGYDENVFADNSFANQTDINDLIQELIIVRKSTLFLYKGFNKELINQKGTCSGIEISVLALGFQMVGHQIHHLEVIEDRYLSML